MKMLLLALLCALTYAQTGETSSTVVHVYIAPDVTDSTTGDDGSSSQSSSITDSSTTSSSSTNSGSGIYGTSDSSNHWNPSYPSSSHGRHPVDPYKGSHSLPTYRIPQTEPSCPSQMRWCQFLSRCVDVSNDDLLERCISEIDNAPELSCEDFISDYQTCTVTHEEWCYWDPVDGCKDKEGTHAGGAGLSALGGTVVIPSSIAAQIADATAGRRIRHGRTIRHAHAHTHAASGEADTYHDWSCEDYKIDRTTCLNAVKSEWCYWDTTDGCKDREDLEQRFHTGAFSAQSISNGGVTGSTDTGSNAGTPSACTSQYTRWCPEMGVCVSILSDNFLERCLSEHDVGPEMNCEDWAFSQESCAAHSEWCYYDPVDGCKDKETIGLAVLQKSHMPETAAKPISGLEYIFVGIFCSTLSFFVVTVHLSKRTRSQEDKHISLL